MKDIIFCALPYLDLTEIYSAPAILKSVAIQNGFTASTKDFGVDLYKECGLDKELYYKIQHYFISTETQGLSDTEIKIIDRFFDNTVAFFKNNPSKYIGLSALSNFTHKAILRLLAQLRDEGVTTKVVVGGRGLDVCVLSTITKEFGITGINKSIPFGQYLQQQKLVDAVIHGDGEDALVEFLTKGDAFTYNAEILISDSYRRPDPDYSDHEFNFYHFSERGVVLPVTGSKGCVRNCDFCDIPKKFGRYRYRSGKDVAEEMIAMQQRYNVNHFVFTDSLVNGGIKPLREFLEHMAEFNLHTAGPKITWTGQYISRPAGSLGDEYYELLARSGAEGLTIGAESGSNHVLDAMQKKTTVEGLFYDLEMFRKHNITCTLLSFVGHWSERYDDFIEHCKMLIKLAPYIRSGTISILSLGNPFLFTDVLPDETKAKSTFADFSKEMVWVHQDNVSNTFKERVYRRLIIGEIADRLHYPTRGNSLVYQLLSTTIENNAEEINNFYKALQVDTTSKSEIQFKDFDVFYQNLLKELDSTVEIKVKVLAHSSVTDPAVEIRVNDTIITNSLLAPGEHQFTTTIVNPSGQLKVSIALTNKTPNDTIVEDGVIVADKFIELSDLVIQGVEINKDYNFYQQECIYLTESGNTNAAYGLWENGSISFNFNLPFIQDYCNKSDKNRSAQGSLALVGNRSFAEELARLTDAVKTLTY